MPSPPMPFLSHNPIPRETMENFIFDDEMGGWVTLCDRCGTAKGVRSSGLCDPCEVAWGEAHDEDGHYVYDDHTERMHERRQMGLGNF